uniref:Uncharacterized protein n=1 Tax=Anguilla anguilla TaxID=7936 RepID=A0A0E9VDM9_ANGAN
MPVLAVASSTARLIKFNRIIVQENMSSQSERMSFVRCKSVKLPGFSLL